MTIINRSEIVGRPLAAMLANDGAEVYSIDIDSIYLFSGGRLHKCEGETPESCVRKVNYCVHCFWIGTDSSGSNVAILLYVELNYSFSCTSFALNSHQ